MKESKYLKVNEENLKKFLSIPVLKEFETKDLEGLLKVSKIRHYDAKEVIMKEGEKDSIIFFLLSGSVKVCKNNQVITVLKRIGDMFGEMSLISGEAYRSASIYTAEASDCLAIETSYIDRLTGNEKIAFSDVLYKSVAGILVNRLNESNEKLAKAKAEATSYKRRLETLQESLIENDNPQNP